MGNILTDTLRAVDYLRVSTEEQAKGYGIAYTGKKTTKYIAKKGWSHVGTFADEGVSGSLEADERPNLKLLMEQARSLPRPFDVVVVPEGRAIGRVGRAFWRWVWELEDLGVCVAVVKGDYDNTTTEGRKKMRKDADYAEEEREVIRERTQGGLQEKAEDGGHFGGNAPYGWRIENKGVRKESHLVIDEDAKQVLRKVWDLLVRQRKNCRTAAEQLNAEDIPSPQGGAWTSNTLRRILKGSPIQEGVRVYRSPKSAAGRRGTKLDSNGRPVYGDTVTIPLDRIFAEDEVARLNAAMARTARRPFNKNGVHPLSKRLYGVCGSHYTGVNRTSSTDRVYRCSGKIERYPGAPRCTCSQVDATAMERLVWGEVCGLLGDPDRLQSTSEDWIAMAADTRVDHAARIADLDRKIEAQNKAMGAVMASAAKQAALEGLDAGQAIQAATTTLAQELSQLQALRSEAEAWAQDAAAAQARAHDLRELAKVARTQLCDMSPAQQAEVLELLAVRITILSEIPPKARKDDRLATWFRSRGRVVPLLTDEAWERVEPLLTAPRGGRPAISSRTHLEAILHKVRAGLPWRDLPAGYGPFGSVATSGRRWLASGLWDEVMERMADMPGTALPADGVTLPSIRVEGGVDPRLLVSTHATPGDTRPCEQASRSVIRFQMQLTA